MSGLAVARRYAKALAQIGEQHGKLMEFKQALDAIDAMVRANPDLERLVSYPLIAPTLRAATFDAILKQVGSDETIRKFFQVVAQAARLSLIHDIAAAFSELVDAATGVVEAQVSSAHPLPESQSQRLAATIGARTGKTVRIRWRQEPTLLGGLRVQLGSMVYDASLQGRLRLLKTQLLSA